MFLNIFLFGLSTGLMEEFWNAIFTYTLVLPLILNLAIMMLFVLTTC